MIPKDKQFHLEQPKTSRHDPLKPSNIHFITEPMV